MADYYINSDYGKQLAGSLKAGDMAEASDGSTWRKEADGSVTVWKNGQTMTGRVGVSAPAVSEAPSSSASPTVETPTLDAATGGSSQQTTAADYTGSAQEQRDQEQVQARLASEKAKAATEKVTAGLDQSSSDDLLNQAIQQASTPEYKISSAQGVLLADELRMAGDMAEASDGSTWRREADGSISVRKGDRTYKANVDRAAAKQDPQWAILTAPAPAAAETGSGKKSPRKSSSGSASSGGSGTYTFPAASTGTQKTPTATATGTDRASLRKQAATAQKEMGDLARQISVAKIRGKETSALQAKYNEAKARYDAANTQIQAPQQLSTSGARQEQFSQRQTLMELATQQAAERKNAWQSLPTVRDSERFSNIDNVTTGRTRGAEQQQIAGAVKALQKDAWRSLPTVQDSGRFNIPSQTDSLMQQAIAQRQSAAQPQTDKGIGGKLFTMLGAGLGQFNSSIANFADAAATAVETVEGYLNGGFTKDGKFAKGDSAFTSSLLQPIHDWAKYTQSTSDSLNERSAANWSDTKAGSVANTIGTGVIAALPQAALALLTLGTSSAGTLTQASSGLAGSIETVMRRISSDPSYWLSFMQETGGNFAEAKGAGATDEQAILASTIAGLANAAIEVGGGLENNNWMNDGTLSALSKAKNLIKGAIEEGGEELIQNPISRAMQKLVYDGDREWLSLDNTAQGRAAVFNPYQSAEEFATGAAVGGILGAGNFAMNRALGSRSQNQAQNTQLTQDELLDAAMQAANRGETLTGPVQAANQTTQQTTQGTAERGAEGVITGSETNKNVPAYTETENTAVNDNPAVHTPQEQAVIEAYKDSVDENLAQFYQYAKNDQRAGKYTLNKVSERAADDIRNLTGQDVDGFKTTLDARQAWHINNDHGINGKSDQSMANDTDVARMQYVLDNYDSAAYGGTTDAYWEPKANGKNRRSPVVVFSKKVNGTYYVVEATPVTKAHSVYVVSAYMLEPGKTPFGRASRNNTGAATQLPDASASWFTANTDSANMAPNANVAQSGNSVNQNVSATDSTGAAPAGFDPLSHASNQYGAIPPGEKASRVVDIPASMDGETKVRRFTRTAAEAQVTTDEMVNRIENLVADGKLDYEVYGNKQALQDGKDLIEKQYTRGKTIEQIRSDFIRDANNGKGGAKFVSQGTMLYADAIAAGDYQTASDILVALAAVETNAGQTVQAARLLKSMSPEGRIFTVQKMVSNLEAQINQRRSANKQIEINVPDALLNAYQNATTETAQQTALDNIYQNIADQVPTTLREGLQQWRYFSMLANPSTHAKNIMGNVSGAATKIGKDNLGALLETIFIGDKPGQRTKAFLNVTSEADRNLLNMAWADYDTASELFEDSVGKYSQASGEINDRRRYWKINDPQSAVTKGIDKALGAAEKVADFNTKALEVEDIWFSKPMYATALASYMKANHMTEITDAARTYAMSEAKRGTFNDLNAVSKWASQIGNDSKLGRFLAGTIYPFKKVPANVMVRTVEYSPLGFAKGVYDLVQMSKGNTDYTAAKAIDDFAAGTTGTALLGIGVALAKQGLLRATGIGDDKEKEQQKNAFGAKDFSLIAGDTYIPIDSFTLNGTALLTGAQIWEAVQNTKNGDEPVSLEDILDALSKITDPVFEQSMLTGLDSVISTIKNSGNDVGTGEMLAKLGIQIVGNYIGQYVPTILGRIASSTDKNQRSTYIEPDGAWDPIQSAIQGVQKKVPGWRQQMAITYGNWGVPVEGNGAGSTASAVGKAVTPIYPSQKKTDPVEEEIARLHDADSAYANFYKRPSKTISVDGKDVKLTSEQYGNYVVARGQTDYNLRSAMLENDLYKSLPDQIKSKAMEMSQAYATEIGREAAGVGYQSKEKWVNDLAGRSQNEVLNAVLLRAVESSGYISPETQAQLTKVEQQFGGADYVGLSDELFNSAKEKANTYFSAVEAAKYGGELNETQKELADKDSKELARYFMDEAINDKFKNSKGETKFDKVLNAYEDKELNEAVAMAVLSDDAVQAYNRYGKSAGVTPEMMLMASNAKANIKEETDEDGKVTNSAKDQFNAWLDKQWQSGTMTRWTDDQKDAVRMAFYKDASTTYSYLSDQLHKGNINTSAAKSELSTTYQSGWTHNVKDTGAKMVDYVDAIVEYEDRPSKEELDDAGYSYVWQWFCDYLNTTDLTREQKYAMAISIKKNDYGDGTKQKIWNRLR